MHQPAVVIALAEETTATNRGVMVTDVDRVLTSGSDAPIVLDVSAVKYLDLALIGALIVAAKRCRAAGRSLTVQGVNEAQREFLREAKIDELVRIAP